MKNIFLLFAAITTFFSCSDYDEQEFTVLLPNAGEDQVIYTETSGTSVQLDGTESSDVNDIGFEYSWEILTTPEGFSGALNNAASATPTLEVSDDTSGRFVIKLVISKGAQTAQDFVNVDINPANAQLLLVNAIDADLSATLLVPAVTINGNPVAANSTDDRYYNIDTNVATEADGSVLVEVQYNGNTLSNNFTMEALKSYTLYVVGSSESPELFIVEKIKNQNSIPIGLIGLDFINLAPNTEDAVLYIDATAVGFTTLPVDVLFGALGVPEKFGALNFKENAEIFFPANSILPLPIWATVAGQRISNDITITLPPNLDGNFGTFILFPDATAANGHTLAFINNSALLPQ